MLMRPSRVTLERALYLERRPGQEQSVLVVLPGAREKR